MLSLSAPEAVVFVLVVLAQTAAGAVAALQLRQGGRRRRALLASLILAAVVLNFGLLGLRGISIRAVPLTGLFESLIVLAMIVGVLYLSLRSTIDQVWFGSVMAWAILGMVLAAAFVAQPASRPHELATTPWAVVHGTAMILASAAVTFAAASSGLYLLGSYRLKNNGIMHVLGRIPNMETLTRMNRLGVRGGFILLTIGVISGLGLVSLLESGISQWLADIKVLCIIAAWGLLGLVLLSDRFGLLKVRRQAYVTMVAFGLLFFAMIGVTIAGMTQHQFSREASDTSGPPWQDAKMPNGWDVASYSGPGLVPRLSATVNSLLT
jgi:ABC-type transport system involved in cytochrome c biogenesis permease subunit